MDEWRAARAILNLSFKEQRCLPAKLRKTLQR